jgi:hypothetical protein
VVAQRAAARHGHGGSSSEHSVARATGPNLGTARLYRIAGAWGIRLTNLQADVGGVESGWQWLPSHELSHWCGAPSVILQLDQDHGNELAQAVANSCA